MTTFKKLTKSGYYFEVQRDGQTVGHIDAWYGQHATGCRFSLFGDGGALLVTGTLQECKETALRTWGE